MNSNLNQLNICILASLFWIFIFLFLFGVLLIGIPDLIAYLNALNLNLISFFTILQLIALPLNIKSFSTICPSFQKTYRTKPKFRMFYFFLSVILFFLLDNLIIWRLNQL